MEQNWPHHREKRMKLRDLKSQRSSNSLRLVWQTLLLGWDSPKPLFPKTNGKQGHLNCWKFERQLGVDIDELFAPASSFEARSRRVLLYTHICKATQEDMEVNHVNTKTATLNGNGKRSVCDTTSWSILKKALYGLTQAPRPLHHTLDGVLRISRLVCLMQGFI